MKPKPDDAETKGWAPYSLSKRCHTLRSNSLAITANMGDIDKVKRSYRKEQQVHDYEPIGFDYNGEVIAQVWSKVLGYQGIVYVQKYSGPDVENKLNLVRRLRHYNLIDVLGIFYDTEDVNKASVTFEFMPVVVIDLCEQTSTHLQELTLAAIVAQVGAHSSPSLGISINR